LNMPVGPVDVQQLDPEFYRFRILPLCKPEGVKELEESLGTPLTFMSAETEHASEEELCPGGSAMRVTEENKQEYLKLLCQHHLCGGMQEQINVFLKGFWDIFPKDLLQRADMTHCELAMLISGCPSLDVSDWRAHTTVISWHAGSAQVVEWFWEVIGDMPSDARAKLLYFVTGSSRLPAAGFGGLVPHFSISLGGDTALLPQAHTCTNTLNLPLYLSKESLAEKLEIALANGQGFGFV